MRFEPGESKTITLVAIGGKKIVISGNRLVDGAASPERLEEVSPQAPHRTSSPPALQPSGPLYTRPQAANSAPHGLHCDVAPACASHVPCVVMCYV